MKDTGNRHGETSRRTVAVKRRALELGFDAVGVATLEANPHADELDRWLAAGYAGSMTYLPRQADKRKHPARIVRDARVAVVTLTNYFHGPAPGGGTGGSAKVAQYAWSTDYHVVIGRRLEQLAGTVREVALGARTRCYVDAGPVPERELAQRAGLGWMGPSHTGCSVWASLASSSRTGWPRSQGRVAGSHASKCAFRRWGGLVTR